MGNIITTKNKEEDILITDNIDNNLLLKYIYNWALNSYKIDDRNMYSKDVLKKRACCTGNSIIGLEFPSYVDKNIITTNVRFEVFKNDPKSDECKFIYDNNNNIGSFFRPYDIQTNSNTESCKKFYATNKNSFCSYILNNRRLNTKFKLSDNPSSLDETIYGSLINKDLNNIIDNNAYVDCNCQNAPAVLYNYSTQYKTNTGNALSNDEIAHNTDNSCKQAISGTKAYIVQDMISNQLCINVATVGNITVKEGASNNNFKIQQSCNQSSTTNTNTNTDTKTDTNTNTKTNNQIKNTDLLSNTPIPSNTIINPSTVIQTTTPSNTITNPSTVIQTTTPNTIINPSTVIQPTTVIQQTTKPIQLTTVIQPTYKPVQPSTEIQPTKPKKSDTIIKPTNKPSQTTEKTSYFNNKTLIISVSFILFIIILLYILNS
jgi:hypothetical protein